MNLLVQHKIIDKSILWDGMTLPRDVNQVLYEMLGKTLARGDKEPVRIKVDGEWFDVSLKNMNNSTEARTNDSLQLRWTPASLGKKMRDLFITSAPLLIDEDGKAIKGSRPQITEYVNIYA